MWPCSEVRPQSCIQQVTDVSVVGVWSTFSVGQVVLRMTWLSQGRGAVYTQILYPRMDGAVVFGFASNSSRFAF